ncbi:biotin--[acetyl-CoA-carboxylase] ligase [Tenacibaculum sp. SZ-18]|uniref:biotin--[acetyl-CoA-carboxylase] ligase n=1 Tax=Tenacibaculum sp. SZ-18 TaxID=754423 RepID=UPI000C2CEB34|nr:biotin--[acetyl-CoA-carboxylase] ligase [Tenacibaculum sp. SZ-18]AUC14446.1 biotin--[acetyl-CoA-carboxylase] ligase [Tenacibaculum sp. SZ-18]
MHLIKLNATASTNSFLKELSVDSSLDDFTVVMAEKQTLGRGQMNTVWVSQPYKNLMFSVYVKFDDFEIRDQTFLNYAVALSMYEVLIGYDLPKLAVKWPNDILSEKKKVCGILIENILKGKSIKASIIGIGLNVNQESFPEELADAASLKMVLNKNFDLDKLLKQIISKLRMNINILKDKKFEVLESAYLNVLYKKNIPSMFKDTQNVLFMGKIVGVNTSNGKLQIELSDETIREFALKEVSFA